LTPVGNPQGFSVDLTPPKDQVIDFIVAVYSADQEELIGVSVTRLEVVFLLTLFYFTLLTPWLLWLVLTLNFCVFVICCFCAPGLPCRHDFHQWRFRQSACEHRIVHGCSGSGGPNPHGSQYILDCGGTQAQAQARSTRSVKTSVVSFSFGAFFVCCRFVIFLIIYYLLSPFYQKFIR
jgi:hypothetical protein